MAISIVIPFRNDDKELYSSLAHLLGTSDSSKLEIIVVNDGSTKTTGRFKPLEIDHPSVKVINNPVSFGVGYSFDRGIEACKHENVILMGCDVTPHEGWYSKVLRAIETNPDSIGCAVCVGEKPPLRKYYGADMLVTMGNDDLPLNSKLRERKGGFTDLFRGKWADKKGDKPYEISCLMGAMYITTKTWYKTIGGFDTEYKTKYKGHKGWGHLEPHLSLKSYLHGGSCILYPDIEATHIFNRAGRESKWSKGARSMEWVHWNMLWVLETMVVNDFTRNRIRDFMNFELNLGVAEHMIRKNQKTVREYREKNRLKFKVEFKDYLEKFNIKIRTL